MYSNTLISLILAGGAGAFAYSRLGKRVGFSNSGRLWMVIGIVFVMAFIVIMMTLSMLHA